MSNSESAKNIAKVREALKFNKCLSFEVYKDGSGAAFHIIDPTGDHGLPCEVRISFKIQEAIEIIQGFRFQQHGNAHCF